MDWILRVPQIHNTFGSLGYVRTDGYHVDENCNAALETILENIQAEDQVLRNYRRNIGFGQNIQKDLIPLLIHAEEDRTVSLIIKILVNLTTPTDGLLDINVIRKTDFGRHTIFEINNLLLAIKCAFTEPRTMKIVIDFLKKNVDVEPKKKLSDEQLKNVNNCLLLLKNILSISEHNGYLHVSNGTYHLVQNQIIWNIFSQNFNKVFIKAMTISNSNFYVVAMSQIIALLYKDQHIHNLHKRLSQWLETPVSDTSEDNESNTSPRDRGSEDSSPTLSSSDPTSDSSDGGSKVDRAPFGWENDQGDDDSGALDENSLPFQTSDQDFMDDDKSASPQNNNQENDSDDNRSAEIVNEDHINDCDLDCVMTDQNNKKQVSEPSDGGYGTPTENQELISTSSNDFELPQPFKKPFHKNSKQPPHIKPRSCTSLQEWKRKKTAKRTTANVINVQGLFHTTPADNEITNIIHEFTVDFLLKGYNTLIKTLHNEILSNRNITLDTSHFFWLISNFLQFATQMELNLKLLDSVLSFEIISYMIAEGVNTSEELEITIQLNESEINGWQTIIQRQHLVVTSIREFLKAIEACKKIQVSNETDDETLKKLRIKMLETEDLRSLLIFLLRHYNPKYHSKQYLKDLVLTNHLLLNFLDDVMQNPEYKSSTKMNEFLRQYATPAVMAKYGLLLEDYFMNEEFVNDCIFTLMSHVGGFSIDTLLQPKIIRTFTSIWTSKFQICNEWTELVDNVINSSLQKMGFFRGTDIFFKRSGSNTKIIFLPADDEISDSDKNVEEISKISNNNALQTVDKTQQERWTKDEISTLRWNNLQCSANSDVIGAITKQLKDDNIDKSRTSVIRELYRQNLITNNFYESQLKVESDKNTIETLSKDSRDEEIRKDCERLVLNGKSTGLEWVQKLLLEICYAKLLKQRKELQSTTPVDLETKFKNFECFRNKHDDMPIVSPVVFHSLIFKVSVPLVPWNCQQQKICKDVKFLELLHKLGFEMPVDSSQAFIRIPYFWTVEYIYTVAGKLRPIDNSMLKFEVCELANSGNSKSKEYPTSDVTYDGPSVESSGNLYQILKQNLATMVNFPPRPISTFTSANAIEQLNWLQLVKKSQQCKLTLTLESTPEATTEDINMKSPLGDHSSAFETTTGTSDFMDMSDRDEKPEAIARSRIDVAAVIAADVVANVAALTACKSNKRVKRRRGPIKRMKGTTLSTTFGAEN